MKLDRILIAGAFGLMVAAVPALRGEEPLEPKVKPRPEQKELLKDPHADHEQLKKESKSAPEAKVSPEARAELDKLTQAYKDLKALEVAGTMSHEVVLSDQTDRKHASFTGSYAAPNKLRHDMKGDMTVVSTGEKLYAYRPHRNDYKQADAPKERVEAGKLPSPMGPLLKRQNLSVLCAVVDDAGRMLQEGVKEVAKGEDVVVDGKSYIALDLRGDDGSYRLLIDPGTHLVRRVYEDFAPSMKKLREDVEKAVRTVDYTTVSAASTAPDATQYAWTLPDGAKEATTTGPGEGEAMALVGKDAPEFTLKGMDDKPVALSSQKGKVVVLDFWATWCGPCRASLPSLNKMYKELKDKGMMAYAVDIEETKDTIQPVKEKLIPDVAVLLDEKGDVAKLYGVGGIPQTVVIGKDGKVKKVVIGAGDEAKIRGAVEAALKE